MQKRVKLRSKKRRLPRNLTPRVLTPKRIAACKVEIARQKHTFHILPPSSFPSKVGVTLGLTLFCACFYMHGACFGNKGIMHLAFIGFWVVLCQWFYAIVVESAEGFHTKKVRAGLRTGVVLFIVSEVMFFFAFFWGFVHLSSVDSLATGA
jgi:hypothetical protein